MLNPNIGKLIENYDNRYRLVIDVARTARDVAKKAEDMGDILIEKPVSIAIDKLSGEIDNK
ncbi:MAG: DNA-directed RNA polymerase subunit omega [Clostridia bacterium]|nr:DNA-directed RNA polymerase subunit omega [Clostridia bacterium]